MAHGSNWAQACALLAERALPSRTRAAILDVQMAFQGMAGPFGPNGTYVPLFGPFINSLNATQRAQWRNIEKSQVINGRKTTHCLRQLSYAYANDQGYTYPLPPNDFTQNLSGFRARLIEDLNAGLIPVVEMAGDGQAYSQDGGTYGWPWFMANYDRIVDGIGEDVLDACAEFHCWEALSNGGWSHDNLLQAFLMARARRPNAKLFWHDTYAWPGDGQEGTLGPIGEWATPGMLACDGQLSEGSAPFMQNVNGTWVPMPPSDGINGWQQRACCFLKQQGNPLIYPSNVIPYYWTTDTPRGPRKAIATESDMYRWVRNEVSLDEIWAERGYQGQLGFTNVC